MKRTQVLLGSAALVLSVAACDGLREAFTAHVDTVARAEGQELSTDRVATLVGKSQIPVNKDVLTVVSDFWVSYQLLGHAGAHGDALNDSLTKNWWVKDTKAIDDAMWASLLTTKTQRFYDQVSKTFPAADTTGLDQKYAQGNLLAAQHILFMMPERGAGMSKQKQDSVRARAEDVLKKTNSGNFNAMAKQYTEENGSKETFGQLPVFPLGPKQG
ncbi:MAG TPA: peptidylprolyl isomerase, partial [Gemmatimonadaceae bacterium]|nr:peptidylprolyl isomerase [Gemmatimonadaceae bacterium]